MFPTTFTMDPAGDLDLRAGLKIAHETLERICAHNTRYYRDAEAQAAAKAPSPDAAADNTSLASVPAELAADLAAGLCRFTSINPITAKSCATAPRTRDGCVPLSDDGDYRPSCQTASIKSDRGDEHRRCAPACEPLTYFHSRLVSRLSLWRFATALATHTRCDLETTLVALVLFTRYCDTMSLRPTLHMMHRLYVACLQVGLKAHSDAFLKNSAYARVAGITLEELNRLEYTLLQALHWQVQVRRHQVLAVIGQLCAPHVVVMWGERTSSASGLIEPDSAAAVISPAILDAITAKRRPQFRLCPEMLAKCDTQKVNAETSLNVHADAKDDDFHLPTDEISPQREDDNFGAIRDADKPLCL
jgi:hypothetical protein